MAANGSSSDPKEGGCGGVKIVTIFIPRNAVSHFASLRLVVRDAKGGMQQMRDTSNLNLQANRLKRMHISPIQVLRLDRPLSTCRARDDVGWRFCALSFPVDCFLPVIPPRGEKKKGDRTYHKFISPIHLI